MVLAKSDQGYVIVWATKDIFVGKTDRDLVHWSNVLINLEVFFKSYVVKALLGIQLPTLCDKFSKVLVEQKELSENEQHLKSICWNICSLWYYFKCQFIDSEVDLEKEWFCAACLTSIAGVE